MLAIAQIRVNVIRLSLLLLLFFSTNLGVKAQCVFVNGTFEDATLTGWTRYFRSQNVGDWYSYTGTASPLTGHDIAAPQGTRAVTIDHNAPTTHELYQDVTIPSGPFATLSFYMGYNNTNGYFVTLDTLDWTNNQQFRVDLVKTTTPHESIAATDVLANLYRTQPGDRLIISPARVFAYDVSAFAGQTVRVRFAAAIGLSFFPVSIDNVCLTSSAVSNTVNTPTGSAIEVNLGSVTVTYPSVTTAGTTTIQQLDATAQTGPPAGDTFVGPAYDITTNATYTTPASVCIQVPAVSDPTTFSHLRLLHKEGGVWIDLSSSAVNIAGRQICGKVTSFSPFIVGQSSGAPTSAPTKISGTVTTPDGAPLGGVAMQLSGSQNLKTITNAAGLYSFNVEPGQFYTIKAARGDFSFAPTERSLSPVGNVTDATFTGTPDTVETVNPLDTNLFFVRQQYLDFLAREPDSGGLAYWDDQLVSCGADPSCLHRQRIGVSAAFFVESEFQLTGSFIYRLYNAGLGRRVSYTEFSADRQQVVGGGSLDAARAAFADRFVARDEFQQKYLASTTAESFVDTLLSTVSSSTGANLSQQRAALIDKYRTGANLNEGRSLVLRDAIEQAEFKKAVYNPSFVTMQYFGYLRRSPEEGGYRFWLNILDHDPDHFRSMVCSFLTSAEYQRRFASVVTHNNGECGQ
jgi:hypothetical protein